MIRRMRAPARPIGLGLVLVSLFATLALGAAVKAPCAGGDWGDGRQYARLCYTDIVPLYDTEQLRSDRLPYVDECQETEANCDEYPLLTMYAMRFAAWFSHDHETFLIANEAILAVAAFAIAVCLYLLVGSRALYFTAAPTLLVYGFMNWDLFAVAFATAGTLAFLNRRNTTSGALLGLGAATKLYPALLVLPKVAERLWRREPVAGVRLAWAAAITWVAVNLPFALLAPQSWWTFYGFNSARGADWDSIWFIGCHRLTGVETGVECGSTRLFNIASFVALATTVAFVWRAKARRHPGFPRWTAGFPLLILFLLTSKVYSPQYGLWLLPWFALALPSRTLFALFQLADVAVFVTRFSWFGRLTGASEGMPFEWFEYAIVLRTVVLVACLVAWVRREPQEVPLPVLDSAQDVAA